MGQTGTNHSNRGHQKQSQEPAQLRLLLLKRRFGAIRISHRPSIVAKLHPRPHTRTSDGRVFVKLLLMFDLVDVFSVGVIRRDEFGDEREPVARTGSKRCTRATRFAVTGVVRAGGARRVPLALGNEADGRRRCAGT